MDINTWSVTADKTWIHVNPTGGTLPGDINCSISADTATGLTPDSDGTVTITIGDKTFTKKVKQCIPGIIGVEYELEINTSTTPFNTCATNTGDVITSINGITYTSLDNESVIRDEKPLTPGEASLQYIVDGKSYAALPKNDSVVDANGRDITIIGIWNGAEATITVHQEGLSEDEISSTAITNVTITYENMHFNDSCKDIITTSCSGGTINYSVNGSRVTRASSKTGITKCGNSIVYGSESESSEAITNNKIRYTCDSSDVTIGANGAITYPANETMSPIVYAITASVNDSSATIVPSPITTTLTVIDGECGGVYKVYIFTDKPYVSYNGTEDATLTYFATRNDYYGDNVPPSLEDALSHIPKEDRVTDNLVVSQVTSFSTVTLKDEKKDSTNNVMTIKADFAEVRKQEGETGNTYIFKATYKREIDSNNVSIYQYTQYENVLPFSDYIIFRYIWGETDGQDLDTLTIIKIYDRNGNEKTTSYTNKAVGWAAEGGYYIADNDYQYYLRHSGDNVESGAEGAVLCLSKIASDGILEDDDVIEIRIYTNWYRTPSNNPSYYASITYEGIKCKDGRTPFYGKNNNSLNDIIETSHGNYVTFSNNPNNTTISFSTITGPRMCINARGSGNGGSKPQSCKVGYDYNGGYYSYFACIRYNIANDLITHKFIPQGSDNGRNLDGSPVRLTSDQGVKINIPKEGGRGAISGVKFTMGEHPYYMFESGSDDYIKFYLYPSSIDLNDVSSISITSLPWSSTGPITYTREDGGGTYTLFNSLKLEKESSGIKITYDIAPITDTRLNEQIDFDFFMRISNGCEMNDDGRIGIYQDYK